MVLTIFSPILKCSPKKKKKERKKKKKVFRAKWLADYSFWSISNKFNNIHMHSPPPLN